MPNLDPSARVVERAATGRDDDLSHEPRLVVSFVPAFEPGWTDVEIRRGERVCVMAHVLRDRATSFADAALRALGGC